MFIEPWDDLCYFHLSCVTSDERPTTLLRMMSSSSSSFFYWATLSTVLSIFSTAAFFVFSELSEPAEPLNRGSANADGEQQDVKPVSLCPKCFVYCID